MLLIKPYRQQYDKLHPSKINLDCTGQYLDKADSMQILGEMGHKVKPRTFEPRLKGVFEPKFAWDRPYHRSVLHKLDKRHSNACL